MAVDDQINNCGDVVCFADLADLDDPVFADFGSGAVFFAFDLCGDGTSTISLAFSSLRRLRSFPLRHFRPLSALKDETKVFDGAPRVWSERRPVLFDGAV